jgi:hypothetical protein
LSSSGSESEDEDAVDDLGSKQVVFKGNAIPILFLKTEGRLQKKSDFSNSYKGCYAVLFEKGPILYYANKTVTSAAIVN